MQPGAQDSTEQCSPGLGQTVSHVGAGYRRAWETGLDGIIDRRRSAATRRGLCNLVATEFWASIRSLFSCLNTFKKKGVNFAIAIFYIFSHRSTQHNNCSLVQIYIESEYVYVLYTLLTRYLHATYTLLTLSYTFLHCFTHCLHMFYTVLHTTYTLLTHSYTLLHTLLHFYTQFLHIQIFPFTRLLPACPQFAGK